MRNKNAELRSDSDQLVALLGKQTADTQEEAAQLRRDNLLLKAQIEPRDLTLQQEKAIAEALEPFRGKFILILAYKDPEPIRLSLVLAHALTGGADADHTGTGPLRVQAGLLEEGVTLPPRMGVEVTGNNKSLVEALKKALSKIGHLERAPELKQPRAFLGGLVWSPKTPVPPDATIYVGAKRLRFGASH